MSLLKNGCLLGTLLLGMSCAEPAQQLDATDDDLTSSAAVERELTIDGMVYVDDNPSNYTVLSAVQRQVRTAFGPLRIGKISVDDREFKSNVDPSTFVQTPLEVVSRDPQSGERTLVKKITAVKYQYKARALVNNSLANRSTFSMAMLMGFYPSFVDDIIKDCVENYEHDQEFASSFWYVFSPNEYSCKALIKEESEAINTERTGLGESEIGELEYARRFLPLSVKLKAAAAPETTFPEYDKLYGVDDPDKDKIVVYQVVGIASHVGDPEEERFEGDMGFAEFFKTIDVLDERFGSLRVTEDSECDPLSFEFDGETYKATFADLSNWVINKSNFPAGVPSEQRKAFRRAIHDHILLKWITLEAPLEVTTSRSSKKMTLEIHLIFGTDSGWGVKHRFKKAFGEADVVLYDGHSYIGSGPLDPTNYQAADFADKYQIFFFNSCVSFNYYSVDYFDLKPGGTQELDLVTNGLGVWIRDGGKSMGQFIAALFDGKQNTWLKVLEMTRIGSMWGTHDPNRAVDGEQDNLYTPLDVPITVTEGSWDTLTVQNTSAACGSTVQGAVELSAESPGAARVEFLLDSAQLAVDTSVPYAATWDSTAVTDGEHLIEVIAEDAAGNTGRASCTVTVANGQGAILFSDSMEEGPGSWTATGLWNLTRSGACASPAYASPESAWYFGQLQSCDFETGERVQGTLTSKSIGDIAEGSLLRFSYYRDVEHANSGSYDQTVVEVAEAGSGAWKVLWAKDSQKDSQKAWLDSGPLSLADFAGKQIQVRFSFDSVDDYNNGLVGWMIDDVVVTQ